MAYTCARGKDDADSRIFPVPSVGFADPRHVGYHRLGLLGFAGEYPA